MWSAWRVVLPSGFLTSEEVLLLARVSRRANQLVAAPGSWPRHVAFTWMDLDMAMARLHSATFKQKTLALKVLSPVEPSTLARLRGVRVVELVLFHCKTTNAGLKSLRGLPLTSLDICGCDEITDAGLAHLRGLPLNVLHLFFCPNITDDGLAHICGLPLTSLRLVHSLRITDAGLAHLCGLPLSHLHL